MYELSRRDFAKLSGAAGAAGLLAPSTASLILVEGCSQSGTAALVQILGTAGASIATIMGAASIAATLTTDTAEAVKQVLAWKPGTPAQAAIQILDILAKDYSLIPVIGADPLVASLIVLGVGTIDSILALLPQSATKTMLARPHHAINHAPKDAKEFKAQFNALINSSTDPKLQSLLIK